MWFFVLNALIGPLLLMASAQDVASSASHCTPATVYSYITITQAPPTVTIAEINPAALSSEAASDASLDSEYESEQSQLRPVSEAAPTTLPVHTEVLTAPAFALTKASDGVYWAVSPTTTRWGVIPTGDNWPVGTTLVTVYPNSARTSHTAAQEPSETVQLTRTVSPLPESAVSAVSAVSGSTTTDLSTSTPPFALTNSSGVSQSTAEDASTVTGSDVATETATVGPSSELHSSTTGAIQSGDNCGDVCVWVCYKDFGCWCNNWGGPGVTSTATCYSTTITPTTSQTTAPAVLAPRQTCTLISAPGFGSWCNNWDGTSVLTYTTWETTTTPGVTESGPTTTATSTRSAAASSTSCGQSGPFEITFDNMPVASWPGNDSNLHPPFDQTGNFYNHLVWGLDWTYGPPPDEPYRPQSSPLLAWYIPGLNDGSLDSPTHNTGTIPPGASFGAGPRNSNSTFWFNAASAYVGCDNVDSNLNHTCDFVATAYQYRDQSDEAVATQHFTLAPCTSKVPESCSLEYIEFSPEFSQLSALSMYANVGGQVRSLYLDSLMLDWWDNNCTAGLERQGSP